jgi:AraC family ethanolamine operon transcriptional activator
VAAAIGKLQDRPEASPVAEPTGRPGDFPAGLVRSVETAEPDELAQAPLGWDQAYLPLEAGRFRGSLLVAHTAQLQIGRVDWSRALLARGATPEGCIAVAMPMRPERPVWQRGIRVGPADVAIGTHAHEFEFRTSGTEALLAVAVRTDLLERTVITFFGPLWESVAAAGFGPAQPLRHPDGLRTKLRLALDAVTADPGMLLRPGGAEWVEQSAVLAFLAALGVPPLAVHPVERRRLAKRAEAFLMAHLDEPVSIHDLCRATGAAERTLHQAFRDYFGLPPMAFLKLTRLTGVRRDLRRLGAATPVTDTATRWGFFHFGEFAAAYRRQFAERPSDTLRLAGGRHQTKVTPTIGPWVITS